jgi:hypothetical protein
MFMGCPRIFEKVDKFEAKNLTRSRTPSQVLNLDTTHAADTSLTKHSPRYFQLVPVEQASRKELVIQGSNTNYYTFPS